MAPAHPTALQTYSRTAARSARLVLGEYSTSFSLACRMLDAASAAHIANIYALVRLADEVVDGVASQAGLNPQAVGDCLDELQQQTALALQRGYSTNLVVHAFALTARETRITTELTDPFFASMRADLSVHRHSEQSLREYIYGSAEVVGLMCLQVFRTMPGAPAQTPAQAQLVERAARSLGAAFQKVNFLRDVATDSGQLDRVYFPGTDLEHFTEEHKRNLVQDIEADLAHARAGMPYLAPAAARAAPPAPPMHSLGHPVLPVTDLCAPHRLRLPGAAPTCPPPESPNATQSAPAPPRHTPPRQRWRGRLLPPALRPGWAQARAPVWNRPLKCLPRSRKQKSPSRAELQRLKT